MSYLPRVNKQVISDLKLDLDDIKKLYYDMLLIRRFEERAAQFYNFGLIAGFCHLYIGQEAIVTGLNFIQEPQDSIITAYRDHGHMLLSGTDPRCIMSELMGRIDGSSKGKGGSMHMFSTKSNFYGGHGIVGAQVSIGTGLAFANKYKEQDNTISIVYMGDGALNQGQVYESFNMASLWNLPVLYIVENNLYAMGTSIIRSSANVNFEFRGKPFGIPGVKLDGMNILEVIKFAKLARSKIIQGHGPQLLIIDTYRYRGHSMSDPGTYRSKLEVERIKKKRDPINVFKFFILNDGIICEDEIDKMNSEIKVLISEVMNFTKNSSEPNILELTSDVII